MDIPLYCPRCADRIHRRALALDFNEIVACPSCSAQVKASKMLTDEGKTLVDYLALLTVQTAQRKRTPG